MARAARREACWNNSNLVETTGHLSHRYKSSIFQLVSTQRNGRYRQIECSVGGVGSGGTKEVPSVASDIEEYCETSIILGARFCNELDPGTDHPVIDRIEVFNSEEEANASSYLGSYG